MISFNQTWYTYELQFGDPKSNFWTGGEFLYYLTRAYGPPEYYRATPKFLRVAGLFEGTKYIGYYYGWRLSQGVGDFRFWYSTYQSPNGLPDCLATSKEIPFSTKDFGTNQNCAISYGAG